MEPTQIVLATVIVAAGAAIQGAVGFGSALFAAPLLVLVDPAFVPVPINMAGVVLSGSMMRHDPGIHYWRAVRWPIVGLVPGSIAGAATLRALSDAPETVAIGFGVLILVAVGLSVVGLHPRRAPAQLVAGGSASGFMGTMAGIGGPPIALFFQHASGPEIRGALARFFGVSAILSLSMLALFGQVTSHSLIAGLVLVPGTLAGHAASRLLVGHLDAGHVRKAVLGLSAASAVFTIARAIAT